MSLGDNPNPLPDTDVPADAAGAAPGVFRRHGRRFENNRFVYPVVSRRSRGVSVGINLNPDRICNFDCIYCQVDRRSQSETRFVDMPALLDEVESVLGQVLTGEVFQSDRLKDTPAELRRLNDLAFSGDGEPTTFVNFDEIVQKVAGICRRLAPPSTRLVLITNASMFHREHVQRGLEILDAHNGQIWAKLDAGTPEYYHRIERTQIPFQQILNNITDAARRRPLVIQSLFMNVAGESPPDEGIRAWCDRLLEITAAGGHIDLVQIYTVARPPAESFVTALTTDQLLHIASQVERRCGLRAAVFA